jgi:hypothetical protein
MSSAQCPGATGIEHVIDGIAAHSYGELVWEWLVLRKPHSNWEQAASTRYGTEISVQPGK